MNEIFVKTCTPNNGTKFSNQLPSGCPSRSPEPYLALPVYAIVHVAADLTTESSPCTAYASPAPCTRGSVMPGVIISETMIINLNIEPPGYCSLIPGFLLLLS